MNILQEELGNLMINTFGITGSIACGKSTVSSIFRDNNIPVVDADLIAKELMLPGNIGYKKVITEFPDFLLEDQTIDRKKLGKLIFSNPSSRKKLDSIMLPLVNREVNFQINKLHENYFPIVGLDSALIIESGELNNFRPLVVVHCAREAQIERLMKRNGLTRDDALARMNCQMTTEEKLAFADYTIDTSNSTSETILLVLELINKFKNDQK